MSRNPSFLRHTGEFLPSVVGIESFLHTTPTSSPWTQSLISQPLCWQAAILFSSPRHLTLSIKMGNEEFPGPKDSTRIAPVEFNILQTTVASLMPQWSSQTVPHLPWWYTSTRPSWDELVPLRRTLRSVRKTSTILSRCPENLELLWSNV